MKFIHTADWHLGKLVQGVYMTEDQRFVLDQLLQVIEHEKPDAVIIAGDLYDRAVPPTDAVDLLDHILGRIVLEWGIPVLAISGNHDSPDRLDFGTAIMEGRGLHLAGRLKKQSKPVVLQDAHGEVHVHLIPYADPAQVRFLLEDDNIRSHDDAMQAILSNIAREMEPTARHIVVAHAFVTPSGQKEANTSDAERPLSIGGTEQVQAEHFGPYHYTALGHLHQAHYVMNEKIRYAGSPLKYSISEERHDKGFFLVELDGDGQVHVDKIQLHPRRDMRRIEAAMEDIEKHEPSDDYVYVTLLNESPVLFPMEKVRAVYPNAMHVERRVPSAVRMDGQDEEERVNRKQSDQVALFAAFYEEVNGGAIQEDKLALFREVYVDVLREEGEPG